MTCAEYRAMSAPVTDAVIASMVAHVLNCPECWNNTPDIDIPDFDLVGTIKRLGDDPETKRIIDDALDKIQ